MSSAEPAPVAQFLRNRRDAIADHWYRAVAPTGFVPLRAEQVRQRLNDLTEQVIALLLAEPLERDAARSIGAALASLHYLEPRALAGTQEALAQQLVSGLSTDQIAALYPRLTALLAELAAGFAARTRETILTEQEQIRLALVAERRRAQEALRESEARYRAVSELTSDFAYAHRVEPDGTLVTEWVTPAYSRITGFALGEVSAGSWGSIMHPDDLPVALQLLQSNLANQAGVAEYRIFAKGGAIRWLRVYGRPVWDEAQGRVVRIFGAVQDITERKQAEKKLYEAEARYRTLVEQIPAITYIGALDEASTTLYVSPQIQAILGFSPADYQASPDIWRERLHPDDREWMLAKVARCHATGEPLVSDYRMLTRDGRVVWFHDEAALVRDADGRPLFLQGVMLDITERKRIDAALARHAQEMEALYATSLEINSQPDVPLLLQAIVQRAAGLVGTQMGGLYLIKPDGQTLELVVGHNLPGDYLGVTLHLGEGLAGRVAQAGKPMAVEDYLSWDERAAVYVNAPRRRVLGVPLKVGDTVIGVIDVADDKTAGPFSEDEIRLVSLFAHQAAIALENARLFEEARKTAERLQLVSRRLLEVQEEERRHIARELHDEIGQTLTGLTLLLEMSARQLGDAGRANLSEAQSLTRDLLTRVREMSLDLRPAMLDDLGLLPALLWHLERYTAQTHVRVTFQHALPEQRFAPEIETVAYRVVQEALTNVARHAGVSEATVRLWITQDTLGLQVKDQGTGFDPEAQLANVRAGGLSGMRERVALLGGQLTIESSPGAGACLTVELPLHQLRDFARQASEVS